MSRIKQARLSDLFRNLAATAAATDTARMIKLGRGMRLAVRVRDGVTLVSVFRPHVPIGATEETTIRVNCRFPQHAERWPALGQRRLHRRGTTWFRIVFRWKEDA